MANPVDIPFQSPKIDTVTLEQIRVTVSKMITKENLAYPVEVFAMETIHGFIVNIDAKLLGKQDSRKVTVNTPANWWEMLKSEHAPRWFTKRWPVKWNTRSIQVEYFAVCPHLNTHSKEKHIRFPIISHESWATSWVASKEH